MSKEGLMQFDPWSAVVIALTLVLFLASVFVKGFTHDLLLEAGVFLVSVKLILMAQKNTAFAQVTDQRLERIATLLEGIKNQPRAQRRCRVPHFSRLLRKVGAFPDHPVTSSVTTVNPVRLAIPNEVVMATSEASRPVAISTRPMRGWLWRASNVHQRFCR